MSQDERELALKIRFQTAREDIARAKSDLADMDKPLKAINKDNAAFEATALKSVAALQKQAAATAQAKTQALTSGQAFAKLRTEFASIDREKNLKQLADDFSKLPPEIQKSKAAADQLTAALQKLGATQSEVRGVARSISTNNAANAAEEVGGGLLGAAGRGGRNAVSRFGQEIRALPAVPLTSNLSSDAIGKVIAILGGLNPVAIGVAAGLAAMVVGLKSATSGIEQFTKAAIASQEEVYTLLKTGTREEVQEAIKAKEQELEIARARIEENKRVLNAFNEEVGGVGRAIADALDLGGAQALRVETQKLEEEERALALGLERLGQVSNSTEFATRELAAAEEELAKKRIETAQEALKEANRILDQSVNAELSARLAADKFTEDQAQERIASAKREQEIIRGILESGGGSEENVKKLNEQLATLGQEILTLSGELPKLRIRDSINETIKALQEQRIAQLELNAAIDTINSNLIEKAADLERERDKAVGEAERTATKGRVDAAKKRDEALATLDIDAGEKRVKILEDFQKAERRAIRQFNRDSATAVADRDVLAFTQAQQRKSDELATAKEAQQESLEALNSSLAKQRQSIEKAYSEQLVAINDRLAEQTRIATERYNEQLAQAQQAAVRATQIEQQKYQQQIAVAAQGSAAVNSIFAQFWNTAQQLARNGLNALAGSGGGFFSNVANIANQLFAGKSLLPSFDTGGRVTRSGLAHVDKEELILNRRQQQGLGGGFQFSPTINATSRSEIVRQVNAGLHQFLDDAGIA